MWIRVLLSRIVATFTGPRYFPELDWSEDVWVSNLFRAWEWLVGKRHIPKFEIAGVNDGTRTTYYFGTLESILSHIEGQIRTGTFAIPRWIGFTGFAELIALAQTAEHAALIPLIGLAAAYDNSGIQTTQGLTASITFTLTGSNLMLLAGPTDHQATDSLVGVVWNTTETMTYVVKDVLGVSGPWVYLYYLANPTSGSHACVATDTGAHMRNMAMSFSGCDTSLDASNHNVATGATLTAAITSVAPSTVLAAFNVNNSGVASSSSDGTVRRSSGTGQSCCTKGLSSSGSNSVANTGSGFAAGTKWVYVTATVKAPGGVAVNAGFFSLIT